MISFAASVARITIAEIVEDGLPLLVCNRVFFDRSRKETTCTAIDEEVSDQQFGFCLI